VKNWGVVFRGSQGNILAQGKESWPGIQEKKIRKKRKRGTLTLTFSAKTEN